MHRPRRSYLGKALPRDHGPGRSSPFANREAPTHHPPERPKPVDRPPPGWTKNDRYADPRFRALSADWREPIDWRLAPQSPAIDAGVPLPADWPDPLRARDAGAPDIGAVPLGAEAWRVGMNGRVVLVP